MNANLKKLILAAATICAAQTSLADIWPYRCEEASAAAGVTYTMNPEETTSVRLWVIRCAPQLAEDIIKNKYMNRIVEGKLEQTLLYPVLGKEDWIPDANSEGGRKIVYSNPLNYQINVATVAKDPSVAPCDIPSDYKIIAFCGSGCFTPDQEVWFPQGVMAIGAAEQLQIKSVMSLTDDANFSDMKFQVSQLTPSLYIQTKKPQQEQVLKLMTLHKSVTVTPNHPMLLSTGEMKRADEIIVGDALLNIDGQPEAVMAIEESQFFGKVLNVETQEDKLQSHIIAAQGFLTGDFLIQNLQIKNANRFLLRNSLFPTKQLK